MVTCIYVYTGGFNLYIDILWQQPGLKESFQCKGTRIMTINYDEQLRLFERKVLSKIFRLVINNTDQKWEIGDNAQIYQEEDRQRNEVQCQGIIGRNWSELKVWEQA